MFSEDTGVEKALINIICSHFQKWVTEVSEVITLPENEVARATEVRKFIDRAVNDKVAHMSQEEQND